jgi:hypothetical protein
LTLFAELAICVFDFIVSIPFAPGQTGLPAAFGEKGGKGIWEDPTPYNAKTLPGLLAILFSILKLLAYHK